MVMVIYRYFERVGELSLHPFFWYNIYNNEKYYPGEPVSINIQSLINILQEND